MAKIKQNEVIDFDTNRYRFCREAMDFADGEDVVIANINAGRGLPIGLTERGSDSLYNDPDNDPLPIDPVTALLIGIPPIYSDMIDNTNPRSLRRLNGYRWYVYGEKLYLLMGVHSVEELKRKYRVSSGAELHEAAKTQMRKWNGTNTGNERVIALILLGISDTAYPNRNPMELIPWFPWKNQYALSFSETRFDKESDIENKLAKHKKALDDEYEKKFDILHEKEYRLDSELDRLKSTSKFAEMEAIIQDLRKQINDKDNEIQRLKRINRYYKI